MPPAEPVPCPGFSTPERPPGKPDPLARRRAVVGPWLVLAATLLLALGAACANHRQVFAEPGKVFFVDADCYARMTRVRAVCAQPGLVLKEHAFENAPSGTRPHTTVPFDYATAALRGVLLPFYGERALDLAGAWISPLLGLLTIAGVWWWGESLQLPGRALVPLILAGSPIVAHGFELGRPDHQSLILLCMAFAVAAEWQLWRAPSELPAAPGQPASFRFWGGVSGVAWALGLWTSLYEPGILLVLVIVAALIWNRAVFRQKARLPGLAVGGFILLAALGIEGWRIDAAPGFGEGNGAEFFAAWSRQIGELASVPPWSATLYAWTGLALLTAPVLLILPRSSRPLSEGKTIRQPGREVMAPGGCHPPGDRRAIIPSPVVDQGKERALARANLWVLVVVFGLTCWQVRWGYFLPLVYVLSLPWQFGALPPRWRIPAGLAILLGLWPPAHEWSGRLRPAPALQENLAEQRTDAALLREVAAFIKQGMAQSPSTGDPPATTVLAPWWLSPALAYWSGQPAVAGSSHEALPGNVDAARFFLATDARQAAAILRRRRVRWVVAYEPGRVQGTAADLLGLRRPPPRYLDLALYERPEIAPRFLRLALVNPYFKIYEVRVGSLPHE